MDEPVAQPGRAWVYKYEYWDEQSGTHKVSTLYATRDMILCGLGTPVANTGIQVDRAKLRDGGIYVANLKETA